MRNKKLTFILSVLFVSLSIVAICAGIIVPTLKFNSDTAESGNTHINKNYESNSSEIDVSNPSKDDTNAQEPTEEKLEYFINEQSVSKTKTIVGETTMFTVSFKVFVVNETKTQKTFRASAFTGKYDISDYASFYKIECNESVNTKVLPAGESEDFDFSLVYVVTDSNNFKDNEKYNLTISYVSEEIISTEI
ncbi:MAG: hypothetical protein IKD36_01930 [Clostridia bacterium]|nr:hypothetical protein [Clostridia bacterium]